MRILFKDKNLNEILLGVIILIFVISIIILSCVPPVSKDALIHHLAIPKLYIKNGGMYEIPSLEFSYYPMSLDLIYLIPLIFGNDIFPKFIHFLFALLTAYLVYVYLKKRINRLYGMMGALFFLSIPIIIKLSISVYVDLGLVFFSTFTIILLFKWRQDPSCLKFLTLAAVCCGLGMGIKYNGLVVCFFLSLLVPVIFIRSQKNRVFFSLNRSVLRKKQFQAIVFGVYFAFLSLVTFSPWMIRNYVWTNNPIYPLYNKVFTNIMKEPEKRNSEKIDKPKTKLTEVIGSKHFVLRKAYFEESWWQTLLIPVRIFFQGKDDSPQYFDGKLNPFLFILPIFALISKKTSIHRFEKNCLVIYSVLIILFIFFHSDMRIRYMSPAIPPLVILSMMGLREFSNILNQRLNKFSKQIMVLLLLIMFLGNVKYIIDQYRDVDPFKYITGRISRDEYIEKFRPEYGVIKYANEHLSDDAKILCLFMGRRGYYSDKDMIFEWKVFSDGISPASEKEMIYSEFNRMKITHLIIRHDLFNLKVNTKFTKDKKLLLGFFMSNNMKLLLAKGGYGLYKLKDANPQ